MWAMASCKLEGGEHGFGGWPNSAETSGALPDPRRDQSMLLANGFGALMLLDRLARADTNGARALLPLCSNAFIERWATLHPLATAARMRELRPLQLLAEVSETIDLLDAKQEPPSRLCRQPFAHRPSPSRPIAPFPTTPSHRTPSRGDDASAARSSLPRPAPHSSPY